MFFSKQLEHIVQALFPNIRVNPHIIGKAGEGQQPVPFEHFLKLYHIAMKLLKLGSQLLSLKLGLVVLAGIVYGFHESGGQHPGCLSKPSGGEKYKLAPFSLMERIKPEVASLHEHIAKLAGGKIFLEGEVQEAEPANAPFINCPLQENPALLTQGADELIHPLPRLHLRKSSLTFDHLGK